MVSYGIYSTQVNKCFTHALIMATQSLDSIYYPVPSEIVVAFHKILPVYQETM